MPTYDLTDTQRETLEILLDRYRETEQPVSGSYIAEQADRSPSTISKYMKELRSLNLVVSLRGQKGGYRPTAQAYGVLDSQDAGEPESLYLVEGYDRVDVVVEDISFPNVLDVEACTAVITFRDAVDDYETGDLILVGPTPGTNLAVGGEVRGRDGPNVLEIDVGVLEAPVEED